MLMQTVQSQTKACISRLFCVDKRENRAQLKLTDSLLFLDFIHHLIFLSATFQKPALFLSSGKEAPNLVNTLH